MVVFDCDGVLVDSEPIATRVLLESIAEAGLVLTEDDVYRRFLGKSLVSITAILRRDHECRIDDAALDRMRGRLFEAFRRDLLPIPGMAGTLARLPMPFCVASSSQLDRIRLALEITGLASFFEGRQFSATMVRNGKPAPDLFLLAAARMGVDPSRCVVVEDSAAGIEAGMRAGMAVFGFVGGSHARAPRHRDALEALGPALVFDDMTALPDLLARHGGAGRPA
nr:HAD family hydrolase [Roseospira visakhapatnamensis]